MRSIRMFLRGKLERFLWPLYLLWVRPGYQTYFVINSPGFDLDEDLIHRLKPFIEIGGPSKDGDYDICCLPTYRARGKQVWVSNIERCLYGGNAYDVDFVSDGRSMPLTDGAVGAVFASCMIRETRCNIIKEAARILEPGGTLVWRGFQSEDLFYAKVHGFKIVQRLWIVERKVRDRMRNSSVDWLQMSCHAVGDCVKSARQQTQGALGHALIKFFKCKRTAFKYKQEEEDAYVVVFQKC